MGAAAKSRSATSRDRHAKREVIATNVAGDEVSCPQNARRKATGCPWAHRPVAARNEMLSEDIPRQGELLNQWRLKGPAGLEALVHLLPLQPAAYFQEPVR
jgi:hypothetical protein